MPVEDRPLQAWLRVVHGFVRRIVLPNASTEGSRIETRICGAIPKRCLRPASSVMHRAELVVIHALFQRLDAVFQAGSCGPGPRRSGRRRGGLSAPARCRRRSSCRRPGVRLLATNRKRGAGLPSGLRQEKYFWCVRIAVASTSGGNGHARRRRSRPSARPGIRQARSPRRAARVGLDRQPLRSARGVEIGRDHVAAAVLVERRHGRLPSCPSNRRRCRPRSRPATESDARASCGRPARRRATAAIPRRRTGRIPNSAAAPSATARPGSASISARATRRSRRAAVPASTSAAGRPGCWTIAK